MKIHMLRRRLQGVTDFIDGTIVRDDVRFAHRTRGDELVA